MTVRLSGLRPLISVARLLASAAVLAICLTVAIGVSLVTAQRDSGEPPTAASYHGCVNSYTGVLRIISDDRQCADHESPIGIAGTGGESALLQRIEDLESWNALLQQSVNNLLTQNQNQQLMIDALSQQVPDCLSTEGGDAVFTACDIHVRDGVITVD